uniref:Uncharacterized protein n=1 Tax=Lutzomyia longipalpis TaxID=7200 RepID=A0A7G3B5W5_LUTLO
MQRLSEQVNSLSAWHVTLGQFLSSALLPQSSSRSHRHLSWMHLPLPHVNSSERQVTSQHAASSDPSKQSRSRSHSHDKGIQSVPEFAHMNSSAEQTSTWHTSGSSSDPSLQSFSWSHFQCFGIHRPFLHRNLSDVQLFSVILHSSGNSSLPSGQSFSPSQTKLIWMQEPSVH